VHEVLRLLGHIVSIHHLGPKELAVLQVLMAAGGRVVSRTELRRRAGLVGTSPTRCDKLLVNVRRAVGPSVVQNVRGRGWRIDTDALSPSPSPSRSSRY